MKVALRLLLAAAVLLNSPASQGWLLFAADVEYEIDPITKRHVTNLELSAVTAPAGAAPAPRGPARAAAAAGANTPRLQQAIKKIQSDPRLAEDQRQQAVDFLQRYQHELSVDNSKRDAQVALDSVVKDLGNAEKDPGLALAAMFDRISDFSRKADATGTFIQTLESGPKKQVVAVRSALVGKTLYYQEGLKIDPRTTLKTIRRPDPDGKGEPQVEAVILETRKGAANEQRVLYNRKVHQLFINLKKLYFDQCSLARRINNGHVLINPPGCKDVQGEKDEKLTPETIIKLRAFYNQNAKRFPPELLAYLDELDKAKAAGKLDQLTDWKKLERVQRLAMAFYNENQLEQYQRVVIMQLTNYFSQVTNVQPKQKKGDEQLDIGSKDLKEFQKVLEDFKKGDMEGYSWFLHKLGYSNLDENDKRFLTPKLMALAAEAFADVSYAYKAQGRLLDKELKLSGEERDALIEETQQWLKLAQIAIQSFDLHTQATQLTRLALGKVHGIGIDAKDTGMIDQANKLAAVARDQFAPQLAQANLETKSSLLRQTLAIMYVTYQNATNAYLFDDTLRERLSLMSSKAEQIKDLFLAREFEKVRDRPEYNENFQALDKVTAGAYNYFLAHLPPEVERVRKQIEAFRAKLDVLGAQKDFESIRQGLLPLDAEYKRLVKAIEGSPEIPSLVASQKESARLGTRHARLFAAAQGFANNMRIFDMINELDVYVLKYASPKMVSSQSSTTWEHISSFKWMDSAYNWVTGGYREKAADAALNALPWTHEAYAKLKGNEKARESIRDLLRAGDFSKAYAEISALDSKAAQKAIKDAKLDKLAEDKSDFLDFDGMLSRQYDNDAQTGAMGATVHRFGLLPKLIMGYAGATAVIDTAITAVLTAGLGPIIAAASRGAEIIVTAGKFIQITNAVQTMERVALLSRLINLTARSWNVIGKTIEISGKVILNWGRNFRKVLSLPQTVKPLAVAKQIFNPHTLWNATRASIFSTMMMGGVSAGMQTVAYAASPGTSQYKDWKDAAFQGGVQGASFGAKAGMLTHLSPVPATAFEGNTGALMRGIAETPGPVSWVMQTTARVVPGLSRTAIAEGGPLGALSKIGMNAGPAMNLLVKTTTWGMGMVDGALKYYFAAEIPRHLAQVGYMVDKDLRDGGQDVTAENKETGATAYMDRLATAQAFSMTLAEVSWIMLPSNPAFSPKEIREQVNSSNGYNFLINQGPERAREIELAPNGYEIRYEKPWYQRGIGENLLRLVGVKGPTTETFTVNEQWRQMAGQRRRKENTTAELVAIINAPQEGARQVIDLPRLVEGISDPDALIAHFKANAPKTPSADPSQPILIKDPATQRWREAKKGDATHPAEAKWLSEAGKPDQLVVFDVKTGGYVKSGAEGAPLALVVDPSQPILVKDAVTKRWREAKKGDATHPAEARWLVESGMRSQLVVYDAKTGHYVSAGAEGAPVARVSYAGKPNEVRLTLEAQASAKTELESRLGGRRGFKLREQILLAGDALPLEKPGGGTVDVTGLQLEALKTSAALAHLETLPVTSRPWRLSLSLSDSMVAQLAGRFRDVLFDRKLETKQQMIIRSLRDQTDRESRRMARSEDLRVKGVREQVGELLKGATQPGDKAALQKAADILDGPGKAADRIRDAGVVLEAAAVPKAKLEAAAEARAKLEGTARSAAEAAVTEQERHDAAGVPSGTFVNLRRSLEGELTADIVMMSARSVINDRIGRLEGADAATLGVLRKSLESDASRQVVINKLLDAFRSGKAREIDANVDLYVDIWERAVFGQMVGERVAKKEADGKISVRWRIPTDAEFKNRFGKTIPEFRALQRRVIKESLQNIAAGAKLNFAQMPTGGGKTLTNFTMIEFLDAHARENGRDGVIYVTTNPDLVAQARADYEASFGKKPAFEILTYGDLAARIAQAREQGAPSPLAKFYIVGDEGDKPASEVPTSVGMFNGSLSKPDIDPVQKVLQEAVRRMIDSDTGFYKTHAHERVTEPRFAELLKEEKFRGEFMAEVRATKARVDAAFKEMQTREFRDKIDLTMYPEYMELYNGDAARARLELQKTMIREFKHARETAQSLHGSLEKWVERILQGGYQLASVGEERSAKLIADPDFRKSVINFNNGIAYDNLSTLEGPAGAAYYGREIKNDFESVAALDFHGMIQEAKRTGTIFFATSGTCAAQIRKILIDHFHFKFTGEISIADPMKTVILKPGADWMETSLTMGLIKSGKIVVTYLETKEEFEAYMANYKGQLAPHEISVRVFPGSNLQELERYNEEVKSYRNDASVERGEAKLFIMVGWAGLRGLEIPFKAYKGKSVVMNILDPWRLPTEELTQLIGRLGPGRTEELNGRPVFRAVIRPELLAKARFLPEAASNLAQLVRASAAGGEIEAARGLISELPAGRSYKVADIINAIALHDEHLRHKGDPSYKPGPNPLYDVIRDTIKDPNKLTAGDFVSQISEILKLREGLKPAERDLLLGSTPKTERAVMMEILMRKDADSNLDVAGRGPILEVLIAALGRQAQSEAIQSSGILKALQGAAASRK